MMPGDFAQQDVAELRSRSRVPGGAFGSGRVRACSTQKYCDRSTLFSASTLCASQYSNGPKKFQFGPRRNVPRMISVTHSTRKPNWNIDVGELPLVDRVVAVALLVEVDVRNRHQADDDHARQHHAGHPRIEVDEHFLQTEEVPRRLRRVRRLHAAGRLFERGLQARCAQTSRNAVSAIMQISSV